MNELSLEERIYELNFLGSSIKSSDPFKPFDVRYQNSLLNVNAHFESVTKLDFQLIEERIYNAIVSKIRGRRPVVFLSGGIDSTVLAHIMAKHDIDFDACSLLLSEQDPALKQIEYVENRFGKESKKFVIDYEKLRSICLNYFESYQSPNLDYACLSMHQLITDFCMENRGQQFVFVDGIEGDNLFGYGNNWMLQLRSILLKRLSFKTFNNLDLHLHKANIYTSSMITRQWELNTLYQNFVLAKMLSNRSVENVRNFLGNHIIEIQDRNLSFQSVNMIGMLYYMGRRVAYKNYNVIRSFGHDVVYPYIDEEVLKYGFALTNRLKTNPVIKAPLKLYLTNEGFSPSFVHHQKLGMGFDLLKVINTEEIEQSIETLYEFVDMKPLDKVLKYMHRLMGRRDLAIDHFMFGLYLGGRYSARF